MPELTVRDILQTNYHNYPIGYKVMFTTDREIRYTCKPSIACTPKWLLDLHVESWYLKITPFGIGGTRPPQLMLVLDVVLPEDLLGGHGGTSYAKLDMKHRKFPVSYGLMDGND